MDADDPLGHLAECAALLEAIADDRGLLAAVDQPLRERLLTAAGRVSRPEKHERKALARAQGRRKKVTARSQDRALAGRSGIRKLRESPIFETPRLAGRDTAAPPADQGATAEVGRERVCYICRERYTELHHFYDQMCTSCGDYNFAKRSQTSDLTGRVALVTGSRVKIGYQAAIMLLRAGAHVICTTRFPRDAAQRYARESDYPEWSSRLEIHGIDLRHSPSVEGLCEDLLARHPRLDFILNNACQTVRRPPAFYEHMMEGELGPDAVAAGEGLAKLSTGSVDRWRGGLYSAAMSQVPLLAEDHEDPTALFPAEEVDADLQQVDLRKVNSWRLKLAEVSTLELLEVHLVNAVAPYILNARLKPLMLASPARDKQIVNVSAVEGQFYRTYKSDRHPHTNMAKASLNMMTRTAAKDYVDDGIHMNSVDTGWVTDEDPAHHAESKREMHDFHPPLDIVDGAARICDPLFVAASGGEMVWGQFLKDYRITDW